MLQRVKHLAIYLHCVLRYVIGRQIIGSARSPIFIVVLHVVCRTIGEFRLELKQVNKQVGHRELPIQVSNSINSLRCVGFEFDHHFRQEVQYNDVWQMRCGRA